MDNYTDWRKKNSRMVLGDPFGDFDKDGVVNILDCNPSNRSEQGFFDKPKEKTWYYSKGKPAKEYSKEMKESKEAYAKARGEYQQERKEELKGKIKEGFKKGKEYAKKHFKESKLRPTYKGKIRISNQLKGAKFW